MNGRTPLIVVTLPGRTVTEVRSQVEIARAAGADLAEVRIDRWASGFERELPQLFPSSLPLIATLRSRAEGGEGPDTSEERSPYLEAIFRLPFRWVDLEEGRDTAPPPGATSLPSPGRIWSTHFPEGTSVSDVAQRVADVAPVGSIRKVVVPASVGTLLRDLLPLVPGLAERETVLHTTGLSGPLLRAWSRRWNLPLVYSCLPESNTDGHPPPVEASQIPVDRLRHFFNGGDAAPLFAVTGHPVAHSRSPQLHCRWMRTVGQSGIYVALDIATESELVEALDPLAAGGFRGLNVTHPWKAAALDAATEVGPGAEACGAANCLTFRDGEIEAENTDLAAILRRLEELRQSAEWDGGELAVVGSGGAAAATLAAARELRVPATVFARDSRRARSLSERLGATVGLRPEARPYSLVVHATDVGRGATGPLEVPLGELVGPRTRVLDWVYAPDDATIRKTTAAAGGKYEDGWRLLVYQAAASFGLWWGSEPNPEELNAAIAEGPCVE
jgi:shikimate dehydrogenase